MKIIDLKDGLIRMEDPRRTDRGNIRHKLEDIITIGLCTLIGNGEDFEDMEDFGKEREEWFREFLELPNGIPCSDTFRRLFERLNPESLSECLYDWLANNRKEGSVIAIDGKTICGSSNHAHKAYHVVSAFIAENQITLGEITTDVCPAGLLPDRTCGAGGISSYGEQLLVQAPLSHGQRHHCFLLYG